MNKPGDFWECVAHDVCAQIHAMNDSIPAWDDLDDPGKKSMVLICQLAVKAAAQKGRALLPYEPEPDEVA